VNNKNIFIWIGKTKMKKLTVAKKIGPYLFVFLFSVLKTNTLPINLKYKTLFKTQKPFSHVKSKHFFKPKTKNTPQNTLTNLPKTLEP
jgi:hypothetical protein